jgi:hypothetical protein
MRDIAILVGNGVNTISEGITWEQLLSNIIDFCQCKDLSKDKDKPFPLFYEEIFLNAIASNSIENEVALKRYIADQVLSIRPNEIHELIRMTRPKHIITANYEFLLEGQTPKQNDGVVQETKFSVFRKFDINGIAYWHIHGDCNKPMSINLGYEHYSGQLQKMRNYVTSGTDYKSKNLITESLARRLKNNDDNFIIQSWIDLFFLKDVHIIGLTLGFVETDLWWLLTYRARIAQYDLSFKVNNKIIFYIPSEYYEADNFRIKLLKATGVDVQPIPIEHGADYYKYIISKL